MAAANASAAYGVKPAHAISAMDSAPASGVPADLGMHDPEQGAALAKLQTDHATAASSPPLTAMLASSPAHAAAVGDDYEPLAKLGRLTDLFTNRAQASVVEAGMQALKFVFGGAQGLPGGKPLLPNLGDVAAAVFRTAQGAIPRPEVAAPTTPLERGVADVGTYAPYALLPDSAYGRVANVLLPLGGEKLGRTVGRAVGGEKGEEIGAQFGALLGGLGASYRVATHVTNAHPAEAPVYAADADVQAAHVAQMQEAVAGTSFHAQAPGLSEEFLNHTSVAGRDAWVDPQALAKLRAEGHDVLPQYTDKVNDALDGGTDVRVPLSAYLADTAGKPYEEELREATRFNEDGVSQEEAKGLGGAVGEPQPPREVTPPADIPPELHAPVRELAARADEVVSQVFRETALDKLFETPKDARLTKPQAEAWSARLEGAQAALHDKLLQRTYAQIRYERTAEWKDKVAQHVAQSEQDLAAQPEVNAYSALMRGKGALGEPLETPLKFNSADQLSAHARDVGLPPQMFSKTGMTPDQIAHELGFPSGVDLINALKATHEDALARGKKDFAEYMKALVGSEAAARTRAELGYDVSREGLLAAARDAVDLPQVESLLSDQLKELSAHANLPFAKSDIQAKADQLFSRLPVKDAVNFPERMRSMWKAGNKVEKLIEKDPIAAFKAKQDQLLQLYQIKKARDLAKQYRSADAKLTRWARGDTVSGVDPNVGAILQANADALGYTLSRDPGELQRFIEQSSLQTNADLIRAMGGEGYPVEERVAQPAVGEKVPAGKLPPNMSVQGFTDFMNMLNGMQKYGQEVGQISAGARQWKLAEIANTTEANVQRLGEKFTPQQLHDARNNAFAKMRNEVKTLLVDNLRMEVPLHWVDGGQGELMNSVVNPLMEGKYTEADLIDGWVKAMNSATNERSLHSTMSERLSVPDGMKVSTAHGDVHVIKTRGNLRVALLHLGSETARDKLLKGFGWKDAQEQWLLDNATETDWNFAKAFWKQNEELFAKADEMYMRVRGYGLPKDAPRPVDTGRFGTVPGGHVRIRYDTQLNQERRIVEAENGQQGSLGGTGAAQDVMSKFPASALPSSLYGIERTNFVGPVDLEPLTLSTGVAEMIHDIAFREPMIGAQKVLTDPRVGSALARVLGPEYAKQMMPWLHYIAQERLLYDPATNDGARLVRNVASNFVWAKVAFRLSSALKHGGVGLSHMTTEVGSPKALAQATSDLIGTGDKARGWQQFVHDNFGEVRTTAWNTDTNLRDALSRDAWGTNALTNYRKLGYALFTASKYAEASVTALAKYRVEMADHGDHQRAVNAANKAVRDTQGAGSAVDVPPMLRRGSTAIEELGRASVGLLMGFRNTTTNREFTMKRQAGQVVRQAGRGELGAAAETARNLTGSAIGFGLLPAAWITAFTLFIAGKYDSNKSLGENVEHEFLWDTIDQAFGGTIGASQLVSTARYAKNKAQSDNPLTSVQSDVVNAFNVKDPHWWAHAAGAIGETSGLIPQTAIDVGQAVADSGGNFGEPGQLKEDEAGVLPFIQRAALGRKPRYERRDRADTTAKEELN